MDYVMMILGVFAAAVYAIGHVLFVLLFGQLVSLFVSNVSNTQCHDYNATICTYNMGLNNSHSNDRYP